jgi:hypothetical protein
LSAGGTEQHVLITGLRGVGKTVLLNEFEGLCEQAGWPAEAKEVGRNSSVATLLGRAARRAMLQMSAQKRAGERLRQALRVLKAFEVTLPGDVSFKLDVDAAVGQADSGDLAEDMRDVLSAVGQAAAEAGVGFALILDEVQNLDRDDYEALIMALHRSKQKNFARFLRRCRATTHSRADRPSEVLRRAHVHLPDHRRARRQDARDALVLPARSQGVEWEEAALVRALAYTEGYPYFLQEYGRRAWAQGDGQSIIAEDAETALAIVENDLDENFFEGRIGRLTDAEKLYVAAMAELGDGPQPSAAVARRLGRVRRRLHRGTQGGWQDGDRTAPSEDGLPSRRPRRPGGGRRPAIEGQTNVGLEDYAHEIIGSGFPAARGLSEAACADFLDSYLQRIVERDFEEMGSPPCPTTAMSATSTGSPSKSEVTCSTLS